jgi:hypothetical protein
MPTDDSIDASTDDLGPMPEPRIESGEPNPGGPDALEEEHDGPESRDLSPDHNRVADKPEELTEREDTSTRATRDEDVDPEEESPA